MSNIQFNALVADKRIIAVGPSETVKGTKQKDFVESFDVVIRFNYMFPVINDMIEDIGERTDILYHCFAKRNKNEKEAIDKLYLPEHYSKLKCLVSTNTLWKGPPPAATIRNEVVKNIPHFIISDTYFNNFRYVYDVNMPTLGIVAIEHILNIGPKELQIVGFTLHKDPYYKGYNDNHPNYWKKEPEKIGPHLIEDQRLTLRKIHVKYKDKLILEKQLETRLYE